MKLCDMNTDKQKGMQKIIESRFGITVDFDTLHTKKAVRMSKVLGEGLEKIRKSHGIHKAEQNPKYVEYLMIKESIDEWLKSPVAQRRRIMEGEIEQAEAVLAAKDIVTRIQKMYEDVSSILAQDLPPLSDVIRDQMGVTQAEAFTSAAEASLSTLGEQLLASREAMDNAARVLAGEEDAAVNDMAMPEDDIGTQVDAADLNSNDGVDSDTDGFDALPPAVGGDLELGREKR